MLPAGDNGYGAIDDVGYGEPVNEKGDHDVELSEWDMYGGKRIEGRMVRQQRSGVWRGSIGASLGLPVSRFHFE